MPVKKAAKGNLNKQQQVKIRKLLRACDPDHGAMAISLLEATANQYDYREAFSLTVVKKLINAGNCNLMAVGVLRAADNQLVADAVSYLSNKFDQDTFLDSSISLDLASLLIHVCDWLDLSNVTELDEIEAKELAKHEGSGLHLSALTAISSNVAAALSQYRGSSLQLNGISQISVAVAEQLAAYSGSVLSLAALKALPDNIAQVFARSHAHYLDLHGVSQISPAAMDVFKKHNRLANLTGIKRGSEKAKDFNLWMRQRCMVLWLELCDSYGDPELFACRRRPYCHMSTLPEAASIVTDQLKSGKKKKQLWY